MRSILLLVFGVSCAVCALARDEFIEVSHQELLEYPQKYWSQGIIFKDALVGPPKGRAIKLGDKSYTPFKTEKLGACYADEAAVALLDKAALDTEYIFQGTVLHQPSSFFSRSPSFYVVVQRLAKAVDGVEQAQERLFADQSKISGVVNEVITQIQQDLISYAQKNDVSIQQLLSPDYKNKTVVNNIIYAGIAAVEQKQNMNSRALLGDFIREVFVAEYALSALDSEVVLTKEAVPEQEKEQEGAPPSALLSVSVPQNGDQPDGRAVTDEEADLSALRRRAAIMLKPGVTLSGSSMSTPAGKTQSPVSGSGGAAPANTAEEGRSEKVFRNTPSN